MRLWSRGLLAAVLLSSAPVSAVVSFDWVTVGDPDNPADTEVMTDGTMDLTTGYGSVPYTYQISKYEVTNSQYAEFLNAVASSSDPYGLYNPAMGEDARGYIRRSGLPGSYQYAAFVGYEDFLP